VGFAVSMGKFVKWACTFGRGFRGI